MDVGVVSSFWGIIKCYELQICADVSFLLGVYLGAELPGHVVTVYLNFWRRWTGSNFCTSSSVLVIYPVDPGHRGGYDVLSYYGFSLLFPDGSWHWASFHVLVGHCGVFGETLFEAFKLGYLPSLLRVFIQSGYKSLINTWFANNFHSLACLFTYSLASFAAEDFIFVFWWSLS